MFIKIGRKRSQFLDIRNKSAEEIRPFLPEYGTLIMGKDFFDTESDHSWKYPLQNVICLCQPIACYIEDD
jgi:hypothetical protein